MSQLVHFIGRHLLLVIGFSSMGLGGLYFLEALTAYLQATDTEQGPSTNIQLRLYIFGMVQVFGFLMLLNNALINVAASLAEYNRTLAIQIIQTCCGGGNDDSDPDEVDPEAGAAPEVPPVKLRLLRSG